MKMGKATTSPSVKSYNQVSFLISVKRGRNLPNIKQRVIVSFWLTSDGSPFLEVQTRKGRRWDITYPYSEEARKAFPMFTMVTKSNFIKCCSMSRILNDIESSFGKNIPDDLSRFFYTLSEKISDAELSDTLPWPVS